MYDAYVLLACLIKAYLDVCRRRRRRGKRIDPYAIFVVEVRQRLQFVVVVLFAIRRADLVLVAKDLTLKVLPAIFQRCQRCFMLASVDVR